MIWNSLPRWPELHLIRLTFINFKPTNYWSAYKGKYWNRRIMCKPLSVFDILTYNFNGGKTSLILFVYVENRLWGHFINISSWVQLYWHHIFRDLDWIINFFHIWEEFDIWINLDRVMFDQIWRDMSKKNSTFG